METLKVIALVGQAGSGKSEVAQHLVSNYGFTLVKFAGPLKDMCKTLGLTESEIEGVLKEKPSSTLLGKTPRYAMQTLGTEWGRNTIHPNLWAHLWGDKVYGELQLGHNIVCDDCRFHNEEDSVKVFKHSQIWRILRKDVPTIRGHVSEQEWTKIHFDRTIKNYGTIGELKTAVDGMIVLGP